MVSLRGVSRTSSYRFELVLEYLLLALGYLLLAVVYLLLALDYLLWALDYLLLALDYMLLALGLLLAFGYLRLLLLWLRDGIIKPSRRNALTLVLGGVIP